MLDLLQIAGALGVLIPFAWQQLGALRATSPAYLWPNLAGSGVLAALALHEHQWGFLLLEAVWALVALRGLVLLARGRPVAVAH
jgi:hypothetical protein